MATKTEIKTTDLLAELGLERRDDENVADYFDRVREYVSQGRKFPDSTDIIRRSRIDRTNQLLRAAGWHELIDDPET